ncbi:MAG TPA: hypothetical protein VFJ82_08030 [Longimicrobium sp.]|nr:hypothetical protein [Longimicrobium sp.]
MAGDELATLGLEIRGEAAEWIGGLLGGFTLPGAEAAAEPIAELVILERAVAALAGQVAELEELETALTAGFPGAALPAPPVDAAPGETEDAGPRAGRPGRGAEPWVAPAPSAAGERPWPRDAGDVHDGPPRVPPFTRGAGEGGRGDVGPPSPARPADRPFTPPEEREPAARSEAARRVDAPRADRPPNLAPSIGGGIRGLGDLASLAGAAGLELPPETGQPAAAPRRNPPPPPHPGGPDAAGGQRGWEDAGPAAASSPARGSAPGWEDATDTASAPRPGTAPRADDARRPRAAWDEADRAPADTPRTWDDRLEPLPGDPTTAGAPAPAPARTPIRLRSWDRPEGGAPAAGWERDAGTGPVGESRGGTGDPEAPDERRWDLPPSLAGLARGDALTLGLLGPGAVALPFLAMPGEADPEAEGAGSTSGERGGAPRGSGDGGTADRRGAGFPAPRQRDAAAPAGWPAAGEEQDPAAQPWIDEFGADPNPLQAPGLARALGRRVRPAAEILAALGEGARTVESAPRLEGSAEWPTLAPEPAERPAPEPGAAPDPRPRAPDDEPPVAIVRSVEAAPPEAFTEAPGWPDLDVQDLMDALAREIMHEYRRYYGA